MKLRKWPFRPKHITRDGDSDEYKKSDLRYLKGEGIISNRELRGLQTEMCVRLKNPTTIQEFTPEGKPIRVDADVVFFESHPPCRKFCKLTKNKCCFSCDDEYAKLFYGLTKNDIAKKIKERMAKSTKIDQFMKDPENLQPEKRFVACELDGEKRWYLEYDCPFLGYRELIFPIFIENRVIAVLFLGQIILKSKEGFMDKVRGRIIDAPPFTLEDINRSEREKIYEEVSKGHKMWVENSGMMSGGEYDRLKVNALIEIKNLEDVLSNRLIQQKSGFTRNKINDIVSSLNTELAGEAFSNEEIEEGLDYFWNAVQNQLEIIVKVFNFKYAIAFGIGDFFGANSSKLESVAVTRNLQKELHRKHQNKGIWFDLREMDGINRIKSPIDSRDKDTGIDLFKGLKGINRSNIEKNACLRLIPVPFHPEKPIVIMIGYNNTNSINLPENRSQGYLADAMLSFYSVVVANFSSIYAAVAEMCNNLAFRIFGHESAQLINGLDWLQNQSLSDVTKLRKISGKKAEDLCNDILAINRQLSMLTQNAKEVAFPSDHLKKTYFWAYSEIIFKWKNLYKMETEKKKLLFDMHVPNGKDPYRPKIYGDPVLLDILLYNLVNNAVKYCLSGTKIIINCQKRDTGSDTPHEITATNYGIAIENGENIYKFFKRGRNIAGEQGLGIGLGLVRRIARAHGGDVSHKCSPVSKYNVAIMEKYIDSQFRGKDESLVPILENELLRLKDSGKYDKIVPLSPVTGKPKYYWDFNMFTLPKAIHLPIYEVVFTVTIPPRESES